MRNTSHLRILGPMMLLMMAQGPVLARSAAEDLKVSWEEKVRVLHVRGGNGWLLPTLEGVGHSLGMTLHIKGKDRPLADVDCRVADLTRLMRCMLGSNASFMITQTGHAGAGARWASDAFIQVLGNTRSESQAPGDVEPVVMKETAVSKDLEVLLAEAQAMDPRRRLRSLDRLSERPERGTARVVEVFRQALCDHNGEVRALALARLGIFAPDVVNASVDQLMRDKSAQVRMAAVDVIALNNQTQAYFESALLDSDPEVRIVARARLGDTDAFAESQ